MPGLNLGEHGEVRGIESVAAVGKLGGKYRNAGACGDLMAARGATPARRPCQLARQDRIACAAGGAKACRICRAHPACALTAAPATVSVAPNLDWLPSASPTWHRGRQGGNKAGRRRSTNLIILYRLIQLGR